MPLPALNVSFVSPSASLAEGWRRYAATDTRGVHAKPKISLWSNPSPPLT